jgi:putative flippase GtrA
MIRWVRFNAVGLMGVVVQLVALQGLVYAGLHYLASTAIAVELAVLHNFAWHARWTWKDRGPVNARCLWRFHLGNGLLSLISNLLLMKVFTGWLGIPVVPANLAAITLTSFLNFFVGDRWVFRGADDRFLSSATLHSAPQHRQATKDDGLSYTPTAALSEPPPKYFAKIL